MKTKLVYKTISVREKLWFMKFSFMRNARGIAFFSKIYLRKDLFERYALGNPDPETTSVLEHETRHVERSKKIGVLKWSIFYLLSSKFRLNEELCAIEEEMKILKRNAQNFDIDRRAKNLSSIFYLWTVSYQEAYKRLSRLWQEI